MFDHKKGPKKEPKILFYPKFLIMAHFWSPSCLSSKIRISGTNQILSEANPCVSIMTGLEKSFKIADK